MANAYSKYGRTLLIQFECSRCHIKQVETYESQRSRGENDYEEVYYEFTPPKGWHEMRGYERLLCPTCNKLFDEFLKGSS